MDKTFNQDRIDLFEKKPIKKSVAILVIPTIISQLISMAYNLADTFFVGQTGDYNQVAAISLVFPAYMTLAAIANLLGIGGGSLISRSLGQKDYKKAQNAAAFSFYGALAISLVYSILAFILKEPFIKLLGATDATYSFTSDYLFWVLTLGGVPTVLSMTLAHLVRAEGASKQASIGMTLGGVLNIILDPIFIMPWGFNLMIKGAAIATLISNVVSMLYFLIYLFIIRKRTVISLSIKKFTLKKDIAKPILMVGFPAFLQTTLAMISNTVLNNLTSRYGETAVAAGGIVKKIDMLPMSVTMGLSQGVLPLLAYNYASNDHDRMGKAANFTRILAMSFSIVCVIIFQIFAKQLVEIFINDAQTIAYGATLLRIVCIAMPIMAVDFLITSMFQATGHGAQALTLSLIRKGVLDIPLMYLMNYLIPLYGLYSVQPIVDTIALVVAIILYVAFIKKIKSKQVL
jgi:putative MATE family efflux protein